MAPEDAQAARTLGSDIRPVMLRTPLSHFCRKVDWALTHAGVPYSTIDVSLPGMRYLKRASPKARTVPLLAVGTELIQGSSEILRWADAHRIEAASSLYPKRHRAAVEELEAWADDVIGPLARREGYRALIASPKLYAKGIKQRIQLRVGRKLFKVILKIYKADDYPDDAKRMSRVIDRVATTLEDTGTGYLVTDQPTAADYAVAALLSPVLPAAEHHGYTKHPGWAAIPAFVERVKPARLARVDKRKVREEDWQAFEVLNGTRPAEVVAPTAT